MIGVSHIGLVAYRGGGGVSANPDFISTWDTTQAGSASDTVVLPLLSGGTYSGTIDWGDGNTSALSYANRSHTYASGGTYTITISGSDIQGWQFNNTGDKLKILEVSNWGNLTITTAGAFMGCNNLLLSNVTDAPTIATSNLTSTFNGCRSGVSIDLRQWDFSGVTNLNFFLFTGPSGPGCDAIFSSSNDFSNVTSVYWFARDNYLFNPPSIADISFPSLAGPTGMFQNASSFNQPISHLFTSNLTSIASTLQGAGSFDQSLAGMVITGVTYAVGFGNFINLSTPNYDATLIDWEAQLQAAYPMGVGYTPNINITFGYSQYSNYLMNVGEARYNLVNIFGWTISDGGGV